MNKGGLSSHRTWMHPDRSRLLQHQRSPMQQGNNGNLEHQDHAEDPQYDAEYDLERHLSPEDLPPLTPPPPFIPVPQTDFQDQVEGENDDQLHQPDPPEGQQRIEIHPFITGEWPVWRFT